MWRIQALALNLKTKAVALDFSNSTAILQNTCYVPFFINEIEFKIMIEYLDRYSDTDLPDDKGRWARSAVYKNIRIAWISKLEVKGKAVFSVFCHFPTMQNDTANEHKVCYSFDEAKDFVNERWRWFLNAVS